jgi:DNA-binding NtrC family response regulator
MTVVGKPLEIRPPLSQHSATESWSKRNPSVLFVDDRDNIRTLIKAYLEAQAISIVTAATGLEALRLFQKNTGISVVVTDQDGPALAGEPLVHELLKINEKLKLIIITDAVGRACCTACNATVLSKPYTPEQLTDAVRQLLVQVAGA